MFHNVFQTKIFEIKIFSSWFAKEISLFQSRKVQKWPKKCFRAKNGEKMIVKNFGRNFCWSESNQNVSNVLQIKNFEI